MFERLINPGTSLIEEPWFPQAAPLDLEETETEYRVRVDLKSFDPAEINVEVTDQSLRIRARHEVPLADTMARQVDLPSSVEVGKVTATYKLGTLEVVLPRKEEVTLPHKVEVIT